MNVHVKSRYDFEPLPDSTLVKIISLIRKYDCEQYCYCMSGNPYILEALERLAPDIAGCAGAGEKDGKPMDRLIDKALKYHCQKIQLYRPHFKFYEETFVDDVIKQCHENGIKVNYFWTDDVDDAREWIKRGADCILTNDFLRVSKCLDEI